MPTFHHGRSTVFKISDMTSTLVDISSTLREVSFPITIDSPETTAFGSSFKSYVVGIKDGRFSCSGMYDTTATTGTDAVLSAIFGQQFPSSGANQNGAVSIGFAFEYLPAGTPVGPTKPRYTGYVHLVNYQVQGSVADMVAFSADFQVTSAVTRAVS
jgi:hypothetical protein